MFPRLYCPVCSNNDLKNFRLLRDLTDQPYAAVCNDCGLCMECKLTPDPINVYRAENYDKSRNKGAGGSRWTRFHHDCAVAKDRIEQLKRVLPTDFTLDDIGAWNDIGCSNGAVGVVLQGVLPHVSFHGVEADEKSADEVRALTGLTVSNRGSTTDYKGLVIVSMYDVLEHVLNPLDMVSRAVHTCRASSVGGLIIIECPDYDDVAGSDAEFYTWKHRRVTDEVTEHIWHFSEASLERLRLRLNDVHSTATVSPVSYSRNIKGRLQAVWRVER